MQKIAPLVGIEEIITTYTARHSFSPVLKRSGASIEFISEPWTQRSKNYRELFR
ncbi:MAG: hypothetical protein PF485_05065 [Bacteroidales bacterium]|nr:hypothetical protein [Bacteroidales bacterium]